MRPVHTFTTRHDADTLEARDTEERPLAFSVAYGLAEVNRYEPGDGVVVTSGDGCAFIGEIQDTVDGLVWVTLR